MKTAKAPILVETATRDVECGDCGSEYPVTSKKCTICGSTDRKAPPTIEQFTQYQAVYDYFNRTLFGDTLKPCLLVFREGRTSKAGKTMGHFAPNRWSNQGGGKVHEISLNPEVLYMPFEVTMDTLVHEMCHQWQQDHGTPPRKCYHDKEWAAKMLEVGLTPSDTSAPGGKMTGQSMSDYPTPGGAFLNALKAMPESISLPWTTGAADVKAEEGDKPKPPKKPYSSKVKYSCSCGNNVWGKSGLSMTCGECEKAFVEGG